MSWRERHPVWTVLLVIVSTLLAVMFLLVGLFSRTGGPGYTIAGIIFLGLDWILLGKPGIPKVRASPKNVMDPSTAAASRIQTGVPLRTIGAKSAPQASDKIRQFDLLPNRARIAIINRLELDEQPEFTLIGSNNSALVGTDRRVFVIPEGRNIEAAMLARPYTRIANAMVEHQRNGGRLILDGTDVGQYWPPVPVIGDLAVSRAINVVTILRQRINDARLATQELPASSSPSAFSETAHTPIPSTQRASSLTLGNMLTMNPTEFEEFTGKALEALGYRDVKRVGGAGDLAADLTATDPQGRSAIVQCKRYTPGSRVGSPALQAFIGMRAVHHKADRGIFVTTADYTQQAIELANEHDVVLIDGDDLVKIAALVLTPSAVRPNVDRGRGGRFCTNCGEASEPSAQFCSNCGTATWWNGQQKVSETTDPSSA